MKKSVPWNLIIPKLKQEISADEERQLETWLRSSNNEALFKELQLLWEKIQANVENYTPNTEYYCNELVNRMHDSEPKQTAKPAKKRFELNAQGGVRPGKAIPHGAHHALCHGVYLPVAFHSDAQPLCHKFGYQRPGLVEFLLVRPKDIDVVHVPFHVFHPG